MIKRFVLLMIEGTGLKEDSVLTMPLLLNSPRYSQASERADFSARLIRELSALPEVESVGITANRPFCDNWMMFRTGHSTTLLPTLSSLKGVRLCPSGRRLPPKIIPP